MPYPPHRRWNEEAEERDPRHRHEREFERGPRDFPSERDYPSEFGNYPRRPDDPNRFGDREREERHRRWDEERGPRSFLGDPPRDRFGDPYAEDWQRPMRIPDRDEGKYAGRGPKNYQRSDERIQEDVCDRLTRDRYVDASEIEVSVKDGEITLAGTVAERRMKHIAEECVESVSGARQVHNHLRVERGAAESADGDPTRPGKRYA